MDGTRRWFFGWFGRVAAAAVAVAAWPALARAKVKKVGLALAKAPALHKVDGSVILKIKEQEILFMRTSETEIKAVSSVCTHKNCQVGYNAKTRQIDCSCHGSKFTLDGKALNGPASSDLHNYNAKLNAEQIVLEIEE